MGGSSGGEQEALWGVVVVTWHFGDQAAVGEDDYHENYCLSFILYMRLTGGVCVVVGSSLQSPRPVLHSLQSIGLHWSTNDQDEEEELIVMESIHNWLEVMGGALTKQWSMTISSPLREPKISRRPAYLLALIIVVMVILSRT